MSDEVSGSNGMMSGASTIGARGAGTANSTDQLFDGKSASRHGMLCTHFSVTSHRIATGSTKWVILPSYSVDAAELPLFKPRY
jgi:hypothetical protein